MPERLTPPKGRSGALATDELAATDRIGLSMAGAETEAAPEAPAPSTSEVRAWARDSGLTVPDRGRLRPEIWQAWREAHTAKGARKRIPCGTTTINAAKA